jgi:hypothetical protein
VVPQLHQIIEAVESFELASIGLVAWELCVPEEAVLPAWRRAVRAGLIERVGRCPTTREPMYRLAV